MVVKPDIHALALRTSCGFVEAVSPAPVVVQRRVRSPGEAGEYQVLVAECRRVRERSVQVVEGSAADVRRRSAKAVAIEDRADSLRGHPEIVHPAEHLDVLVTGSRDIAERALEVAAARRRAGCRAEFRRDAAGATPAALCAVDAQPNCDAAAARPIDVRNARRSMSGLLWLFSKRLEQLIHRSVARW